jgi:hypothetical protein
MDCTVVGVFVRPLSCCMKRRLICPSSEVVGEVD